VFRILTALLIAFAPALTWATSKNFDVKIEGMTCDHCVNTIKRVLGKIPNVDAKSVQVILKENRALLTVTEEKPEIAATIKKAIEDVGYKVVSVQTVKR
jgi:copper chaperone CopZ